MALQTIVPFMNDVVRNLEGPNAPVAANVSFIMGHLINSECTQRG
jgi:hypothetical protein